VVPVPRPKPGADSYLEVGFTAKAGALPANRSSGPLLSRLEKADLSAFNEADDYSWRMQGLWFDNTTRVGLYIDGRLVAGTEP
jgi:hypothetical protein